MVEKKMKVLLTVCGSILLLGVVASVVRWAVVGRGQPRDSWQFGGPSTCNGIAVDVDYKEEKTERMGTAEVLEVSLQDADIRMVPSNGDEIEVYYSYYTDVYQFKWEKQGEHLILWDEVNPKYNSPTGGLSFNYWNSPQSVVEIRCPKELVLKKLVVNNNYGDAALKDFAADELFVALNSGDLSVKNGQGKSIKVECDYGDVNLSYDQPFTTESLSLVLNSGDLNVENLSAAEVDVKSDYGDVDLRAMQAQTVKLRLNSGELEINGLHCTQGMTLRSDYGDTSMADVTIHDLDIEASSGDVDVWGDVTGPVTIDSDYGDVDLRLAQPVAEYGYDCTTEYGRISIDGKRIKSDEEDDTVCTAQRSSSGGNQISIRCSSGNVRMAFGVK